MPLDPRLAQEILSAVDSRFSQLRRGLPYTAYGTVSAVDTSTRKATVKISGDTVGSAGFSYTRYLQPFVNDLVRVVIDPRGDRYIEAIFPAAAAYQVIRSVAGSDSGLLLSRDGDTNDRMALTSSSLTFGPGSSARDVEVARAAAGVLRFSGAGVAPLALRHGGTAFPTLNLAVMDTFFRTDLGMWFYWDGVRWLSTQQFTLPYARKVHTTGGFSEEQFVMRPEALGYWVTGCLVNLNVATTHSNTNKWTIETYDQAVGSRAFLPDSWATAPAVGASFRLFTALSYSYNAGVNGERTLIRVTKVGAPGDLTLSAAISYRLVAT